MAQPTQSWVHKCSAMLPQFFPPDDPDSYWLLRLAIIRDDLRYELHSLGLNLTDGLEEVWRTSYFLRRISITLLEARSIFEWEIGRLTKHPPNRLFKAMTPRLRRAIAILTKAKSTLEQLRNAVGGHVRPQNSSADKTPT